MVLRKGGVVPTPPWAQRRVWGLLAVLRRVGQGGGEPSSFGRAGPPDERRGRVLSLGSTCVLPCNSHLGSQAWADRVAPGTNPSLGDPIGQGASLLPRVNTWPHFQEAEEDEEEVEEEEDQDEE